MTFLTVKVIKSHDGIQQGTVLRFAECTVIRQMIAEGWYQLVKTEEEAPKQAQQKPTVVESAKSAVMNFIKNLRK